MKFLKQMVVAVTAAFLTLAPMAALAGWAPARPTYTYNGVGTPGADHVVFNSFVNNPNYGDERPFLDGKDNSNTNAGGYQDVIQVTPGHEYLLRAYIHNNADPSLNDAAHGFRGIARNTKVRFFVPTATDTALRSVAYISADNANPGTVSDTVDFQNANAAFNMSYVAGSARLYTNARPAGFTLGDNIVAGGALIGDDQLDGNLPGCFEYTAIATILVKINGPAISLTKQVGVPGSTDWQANRQFKVGETASWLLHYTNTSNVQLNHVILKDTLPAHTTLVPGSVVVIDSNRPSGQPLNDTDLFTVGVDVGSLGVGGGGYIRFRTTINNDFTESECGNITLVNKASAHAQGTGNIEASATAIVNHVCKTPLPTPPPPVTPPLPGTGMEDAAGAAMGAGVLGYVARAYGRSKKSLLEALRNINKR